jgi:2-(1,2-epoxy-1,2-dihydrophenyl)acetyl-CoA isomerase
MNPFLLIERRGAIVILTMNHAETRNTLTGSTATEELVGACDQINSDASISVAILTGAGAAFSAGGNLQLMADRLARSPPADAVRQDYRIGIQRMTKAVYGLAVPLIAAVNGPAIGAGFDLACMCDVRIASERAAFAESFVRLGLIPGDGGAWLLPRVIGRSRAAELSFTGDTIDAATALDWGLVSSVVSSDALLDTALALAARIARNDGATLRACKQLLREGEHSRLDTVLELSAALQAIAHQSAAHSAAIDAWTKR